MSHEHNHSSNTTKNLAVAFFLNFTFAILEFFAGIMANSVAIISDSVHDLGDSIALGLAWLLERLSLKKRDKHFSYGYRRFSLLSALVSGLLLLGGSIFIAIEAFKRLQNPTMPNGYIMLGISLLSVVVNSLAWLRLRKGNSINEEMVSWHLFEDIAGSAVIAICSVFLIFFNVPWLDPALSITITLYIAFNVAKSLKKTVKIFLQSIPDSVDIKSVENDLVQVAGVNSVHDTHVWSLDGNFHILTTHVVVQDKLNQIDATQIKKDLKCLIQKRHSISHSTIEMECQNEICDLINC